jgi:hypothetical protein
MAQPNNTTSTDAPALLQTFLGFCWLDLCGEAGIDPQAEENPTGPALGPNHGAGRSPLFTVRCGTGLATPADRSFGILVLGQLDMKRLLDCEFGSHGIVSSLFPL